MGKLSRALSEREQQQRKDSEAKIKRGLTDAWIGLMEIRDQKLYRSTHKNFDAYCQEVWGFKRGRGYQQAAAGQVVAGLLAAGSEVLPTNERQARELAGLTPEEAKMVLAVVTQSSPGKVTAAHLKQVGETLKEIMTTGAATDGDGEQYRLSEVVKSGIVAETHERMLRQWVHIEANSAKKSLKYVAESQYLKGGRGTFSILQMLHTLDPQYDYIIKAYRREKENTIENQRDRRSAL